MFCFFFFIFCPPRASIAAASHAITRILSFHHDAIFSLLVALQPSGIQALSTEVHTVFGGQLCTSSSLLDVFGAIRWSGIS
uniref:Putative secreted protein n=1 Tax=Rhipicephalus microplus TaxID=6941 RepID=A0A6M2DAT7_RHIMP